MPARIVAIEHVSLDGVYQAPGAADEDRRNGFAHGGWAAERDTPEARELIGRQMAQGWSLLAGHVTYNGLYRGWRVQQPDAPMAMALTGVQKFVATRQDKIALPWENSQALYGDAAQRVATLKAEQDKTLVMFGSGALLRTLLKAKLIDAMVLMIHPLLLGQGLRLFDAATPFATLTASDQIVTSTGVMVGVYRPA